MRRVLNKDEVIVYEFLRTNERKIWDVNQVRLLRCEYLSDLPLRMLVLFLVLLAGLFSSWLFVFPLCVVLLRIRGFCDIEFVNSAQQQLVCYLTSFFLVL